VGGVREREADAVDLLCAALVEAGKLADVRSLLAEPPLHFDLGDDLRVREGLREARHLAGVIGMAVCDSDDVDPLGQLLRVRRLRVRLEERVDIDALVTVRVDAECGVTEPCERRHCDFLSPSGSA